MENETWLYQGKTGKITIVWNLSIKGTCHSVKVLSRNHLGKTYWSLNTYNVMDPSTSFIKRLCPKQLTQWSEE